MFVITRHIHQCPIFLYYRTFANKRIYKMDSKNNTNTQPESNSQKNTTTPYVLIDGSYLEGGGQILRNSISLSAILRKPIKVEKIRAGREKPGLQPQHLCGIQLIQQIYNAEVTGGTLRSTTLTFSPRQFTPGHYEADTHTAGSVGLLLQIALPCLLFGSDKCEVTFKGGTNASHAPQIDYFLHVFAPFVENFGIKFDLKLIRRGFYPKGGGCAVLKTQPLKFVKPITFLEQGDVNQIRILSFAAGKVPEHVPQRMAKAAQNRLNPHFPPGKIKYVVEAFKENSDAAFGDGTGIVIIAKTSTGCVFGGSSLGEIGKKAETVGDEAAEELIKNIHLGGCCDEYLQDQIIIFMALAKGKSKVRIGPLTLHTQTSIHYSQLLTGAKFTTTKIRPEDYKWKNKEQSLWLECEGIGFENEFLK